MLAMALTVAIQTSDLKSEKMVVRTPEAELLPFVPQPKVNQLKYDKPLHLSGKYTFPAGYVKNFALFDSVLRQRFIMPPDKGDAIKFDAGEADIGPGPGGYRLVLKPDAISVIGRDTEGLRRAMRRLAYLVFVRDGRLMLPTGIVVDEPELKVRIAKTELSAEMTTGQEMLWNRLLLPLGYNRVSFALPESAKPVNTSFLADFFEENEVGVIPSLKDGNDLVRVRPFKPEVAFVDNIAQYADSLKKSKIEPAVTYTGADLPIDIPAKTWIVDQGYFAKANPVDFNARLQALKSNGLRPIVSTNGSSDYLYGAVQSAIAEKAAVMTALDEKMLPDAAVRAVLTADYAWSARGELPTKLPYNPADLIRRLAFAPPQPLVDQKGITLSSGSASTIQIGHLRFKVGAPLPAGPHKMNVSGSTLAIALSCSQKVSDGSIVGVLEVVLNGKPKKIPLIYGIHVRAQGDRESIIGGIQTDQVCASELELAGKVVKISGVTIPNSGSAQLSIMSIDIY